MEILVPLNNASCLNAYLEAGAREFYMGFYDEEWNHDFGEYSDINRMSGFKEKANANTLEDILRIIDRVKSRGAYAYITFNSSAYSGRELERIEKYLDKLEGMKPDGIIISTPELAKIVKAHNLPFVVSTIAGIYNSDIASFYKELGAKRVILPRDLRILEIAKIIRTNPDLEYEIFLMRNGCKFSDSNCLGFHRKEMCSICANLDRAENRVLLTKEFENFTDRSNMEYTDYLLKNEFHNYACGLCAIYDFIKLNINAGKVVGRSDDCESVCEDIRLIGKNIEIAKKSSSREEYFEKMLFPDERKYMCTNGMACYYPETRF